MPCWLLNERTKKCTTTGKVLGLQGRKGSGAQGSKHCVYKAIVHVAIVGTASSAKATAVRSSTRISLITRDLCSADIWRATHWLSATRTRLQAVRWANHKTVAFRSFISWWPATPCRQQSDHFMPLSARHGPLALVGINHETGSALIASRLAAAPTRTFVLTWRNSSDAGLREPGAR